MSRAGRDGGSEGEDAFAEQPTDVGPGSTIAGLDEEELVVLRQVGGHWGGVLGSRPPWLRALPVDPGLHRFPRSSEPVRGSRFAAVDFVDGPDMGQIVATPHAGAGTSRLGQAASRWRRVLLGASLAGSAVAHERMRKSVALPILSSDALSSVAYGPEAMLAVLALAGSGALGFSLGLSVAIVVLMVAVGLSYRQLMPAFQPPAARNARTVLTLMVGLLVAMFAGLVAVMHMNGIVPRSDQTALSQLAHTSFGSGPLYAYVQVATALVLLLAANTAFNGFPRLLSFMARNGHAPRLFLRLGDRLAFSNGTIALAAAAAVLFFAFDGRTGALIPVYAVGVFIAFSFSQAGMVVHWWRRRDQHWRRSVLLNFVGGAMSAVVFIIATVIKFSQGPGSHSC